MRNLSDIRIGSGERQLLLPGETDSRADSRPPAAVMREVIRSVPSLLFFVVAVLILLNGHRFI